jgi:hypothetical protein
MGFLDSLIGESALTLRLLKTLHEAKWEVADLERLDVAKAREMLKVVRPPETASPAEQIPPMPKGMADALQLDRWRWIYQHYFGIELDVTKVKIGKRPKGLARMLVVATDDLTKIITVCESLFGMWFWNKEEVLGVTSIRSCKKGPYVVWMRDCREAGECNRDKRSSDFEQKNCVTLQERLLFEIVYFLETGKHLDVESVTLCGGSRYSDGNVPGVYWFSGTQTVDVYWYDVGDHDPRCAVRSAVSF